jgi:hypothetical protein
MSKIQIFKVLKHHFETYETCFHFKTVDITFSKEESVFWDYALGRRVRKRRNTGAL